MARRGKLVEADVLKHGDSPAYWKNDENPIASLLTRCASAAFTCGFDLLTPKCYQHHVIVDEAEDLDPDEEPQRSVTWIWDAKQKVTFRPIAAEEEIGIHEFRSRFEDLDWIEKNPDHPISYMRAFLEQSRKNQVTVSGPPALRIIRGDDEVIAPPGATAEEIEQAFADLAEACAGR